MKWLFLLPFFFNSWHIHGQINDSLSLNATTEDIIGVTTIQHTHEPEDDFSVGLAFFALIGIGFMLVCIGVGVALTLLGILIIVGLISFGVISTSVLVGMHQKSFLKGFKTFIILASAVGGISIGAAGLWLLNKMAYWWTGKFALLSGGALGLISGLVLGFFVVYVFQKLTAYFRKQFELDSK